MKKFLVSMVGAFVLAVCAVSANAQTSVAVTTDGGAVAYHSAAGWNIGSSINELTQVAALGTSKSNNLYFVGNETLVPGVFTAYSGGVRFQPNLSTFLKQHSTVSPSAVNLYVESTLGNALSSTSNTSNLITRVGGGVSVALTQGNTVVWQPIAVHFDKRGNLNEYEFSMNIAYVFGGPKQ